MWARGVPAAGVFPLGASPRIILTPEVVAASVPGADRFTGCVVQHPALASFHAGLVNAVAKHVIVICHDFAIERVGDKALQTLDVEFYSSAVLPVRGIVRNRQKRTAESVDIRGARSEERRVGEEGRSR